MNIDLGWPLLDWLSHSLAAASGRDGNDRLPEAEEESGETYREDVVLLVDDQPEVLDMATILLESLGFETCSAGSGPDALRILEKDSRVSILFTDVMMPEMNGVRLAREALRINPELRVIFVSGYTGPALAEFQEEISQFPLLTKPYSLGALYRLLTREK